MALTAAEAAAQSLANTATYGGAVNAGGLVSLQLADRFRSRLYHVLPSPKSYGYWP